MKTIVTLVFIALAATAACADVYQFSHLDRPLIGNQSMRDAGARAVDSPKYPTLKDCTNARERFIEGLIAQYGSDVRRDRVASICMAEPF